MKPKLKPDKNCTCDLCRTLRQLAKATKKLQAVELELAQTEDRLHWATSELNRLNYTD
jgi:DNA repair ATPase RecN